MLTTELETRGLQQQQVDGSGGNIHLWHPTGSALGAIGSVRAVIDAAAANLHSVRDL